MTREHKFTMLMDVKEKDRITAWGKTQGYSSLAKLIHEALNVVQRNPSLLQPTENDTPVQLYEDLKKAQQEASEELEEVLIDTSTKITQILRLQEKMALKLKISEKQIEKTRTTVDHSNEAVLE